MYAGSVGVFRICCLVTLDFEQLQWNRRAGVRVRDCWAKIIIFFGTLGLRCSAAGACAKSPKTCCAWRVACSVRQGRTEPPADFNVSRNRRIRWPLCQRHNVRAMFTIPRNRFRQKWEDTRVAGRYSADFELRSIDSTPLHPSAGSAGKLDATPSELWKLLGRARIPPAGHLMTSEARR